MTVHFVGAGPGDPELLTRKAERLLRDCQCCIYAGSLVAPEILGLLPSTADTHDSASMTLGEVISVIEDAHARGIDVVRLHTGEPALYGAIGEQMRELDARDIAYDVTPGISAFQAAAATLRRELTAPEISQTVILSRTEGRTPMPPKETLENFAATGATLCLYLSVHKIDDVARRLAAFYGETCPAAVVFHASWPDEQILEGTLTTIADIVHDANIKKTALILVGPALAGPDQVSRLYADEFSHGYRKGNA